MGKIRDPCTPRTLMCITPRGSLHCKAYRWLIPPLFSGSVGCARRGGRELLISAIDDFVRGRGRRGVRCEAEVEEQGGVPLVLRRDGKEDQHCRPRLLRRGRHRLCRRHGNRRLVRLLGTDRVSVAKITAASCSHTLPPSNRFLFL